MFKNSFGLYKEWYNEKQNGLWFEFWIGLITLTEGLLLFLFPFAVIATVFWGYFEGTTRPLNFVLASAFWIGLAGIVFFAVGLLGSCWGDMAAERTEKRRRNVTIQEIVKKTINFEKWCD